MNDHVVRLLRIELEQTERNLRHFADVADRLDVAWFAEAIRRTVERVQDTLLETQ